MKIKKMKNIENKLKNFYISASEEDAKKMESNIIALTVFTDNKDIINAQKIYLKIKELFKKYERCCKISNKLYIDSRLLAPRYKVIESAIDSHYTSLVNQLGMDNNININYVNYIDRQIIGLKNELIKYYN